MCGIAGFMGQGDDDALRRMAQALAHRGPDENGTWKEGNVGFAHARLSIVDLTPSGHQPMQSANCAITFNGEIFNYRLLRGQLADAGYPFQGTSDTEVILALYETYGEDAFAKLEGQFAFALFDRRSQSLYVVRDRMGEKPLYWGMYQGTLFFSSEPKAIFVHGLMPKVLNKSTVESYLTFDAVLAPQSIFEHIEKLPPASFLLYKDGASSVTSYWGPPHVVDHSMREADALRMLENLFTRSVTNQLVADVPVGVFLSGGLDSSLIAYYAALAKGEALHTFSLGFKEKSYDETSFAKLASSFLKTNHHERVVGAEEVRDTLPQIVAKLDEPIADPAILPNYLLSKFAREQVKVVLGGDGGDELFAGYQTFAAEKFIGYYQFFPKALRSYVIEPMIASLPVSHNYFSLDFKLKQFLRGVETPEQYRHQAWLESFSIEEQQTVFSEGMRGTLVPPYARIDEYLKEVQDAPHELQTTYLYLRTYMQDVILTKADRASMMNSLEVRAPFLDRAIVEYALSMPLSLKMRGMKGKYILRQLMKDKLPPEIVARDKHGFGLPVGSWFTHEWKDLLTATLSREKLQKQGIFDADTVISLRDEHLKGSRNHRKKLWSLLMFSLWYDAWIA